ncbi:hypothetical protein HBI22_059590 [Parastagonospora nodorum]|nr:hypothetical protein HBI32_023910 [Parastagonospora nodorum]KAH5473310.1 hypothetical protein HBI28_128000 [Parastagonospora nodorum]KAH5641051.1 hypothetical protein HBI22_059590 [Parastagonospora nodorum]
MRMRGLQQSALLSQQRSGLCRWRRGVVRTAGARHGRSRLVYGSGRETAAATLNSSTTHRTRRGHEARHKCCMQLTGPKGVEEGSRRADGEGVVLAGCAVGTGAVGGRKMVRARAQSCLCAEAPAPGVAQAAGRPTSQYILCRWCCVLRAARLCEAPWLCLSALSRPQHPASP